MRLALSVLLITALAAVTGYAASAVNVFQATSAPNFFLSRAEAVPFLIVTVAAWLLFALVLLSLRALPDRAVVTVVLLGSVLVGGAALAGEPNTSTDSARYAWDGIVQNAGVSPYRYVPADPALAALRPEWLYPTPVLVADGSLGCDGKRIETTQERGTAHVLCTALNRPQVPTIYPPLAELYFAAVRFLVSPDVQYLPFQVGGLLISVSVTWLLLSALRRRKLDPRWAGLWAFCPLVATEAVTNSHVDVLGAALAFAASLLVANGRRMWGSIALGAAAAVKILPLLVAPALIRRRPLMMLGVTAATFAVLYVPYLLLDGFGVLGYLPGYLAEEGYSSGSRFALAGLLLPGPAATVLVALVLAGTAGLVFAKTDPSRPWFGELVLVGVALLAVSPAYPWYALLLVPYVAMTGRWEWLAVPLALTFALAGPPGPAFGAGLAVAAAVIVAVSWRRFGPGAVRAAVAGLRHPLRPGSGQHRPGQERAGQGQPRGDSEQHQHNRGDGEQHQGKPEAGLGAR